VSVVITARNYGGFLSFALRSISSQSVPPGQVIVVDAAPGDILPDMAGATVPVEHVASSGCGISASRNAGLARATGDFVIFLDADDSLRPTAVERGLRAMDANPGAGFVYGAYVLCNEHLSPIEAPTVVRAGPNGFHQLLRENIVRMQGAVMYDRAILQELGGFDEDFALCEDYELYLRIARHHRIASHPHLVADYRLHGQNVSRESSEMLDWHLRALAKHRPQPADGQAFAAWKHGGSAAKRNYSNLVWRNHGRNSDTPWKERRKVMRVAPRFTASAAVRQIVLSAMPSSVQHFLRRVRRRPLFPLQGEVDFGDFARIRPLSTDFGFLRGMPVDRHYIEQFLAANRASITGNALEAGGRDYLDQFGHGLGHVDVVNAEGGPQATIVGDLGTPGLLQETRYDCIVLTQVLQYIYDLPAAAAQLHAALKPGGTLLITVPAISPMEQKPWDWYWTFNVKAMQRLFGEAFGAANVEVAAHGNAFAATCFIQGIAVEDVGSEWLTPLDETFPVLLTMKATKARD
jgi:glycosyltransferase involved in cell wall biosynthesis